MKLRANRLILGFFLILAIIAWTSGTIITRLNTPIPNLQGASYNEERILNIAKYIARTFSDQIPGSSSSSSTTNGVVNLSCKLEEWDHYWGTDEKPPANKLPKSTITFAADLNSKVLKWGSDTFDLIVNDNSIEFYRRGVRDPEDNKKVVFRYIIDRTNGNFKMIMTKNKEKEGS